MKNYFRTARTVLLLGLALIIGFSFSAFAEMPFNGNIVFHDIAITIPSSFVRDSTQSHADLWIFEKGFYSKYIILTRDDFTGNEEDALDEYAAYMEEKGASVRREPFHGQNAVVSEYTNNNQYCQEMFFAHKNSLYAIALRKGDAQDFASLLDTVSLDPESLPARENNAPSTMFGRIMDYFF